jgi:beta-glucosidase
VATDHYARFREDVGLMARMGIRMYRFSIAWPRIMPDGRGQLNPRGLDFYRRLADSLREAGIEPIATLYHWDLPQPLEDAGGWPARDTANRFAEYAGAVFEALHDNVRWWITLNEPWCTAFLGYAAGVHAPGVRDPSRAVAAVHHLLLAHGLAVRRLRAADPNARAGIALNLAPVRSAGQLDEQLADARRRVDGLRNRIFLEPLLAGAYPSDVLADLEPYGGLPVRDGDLAAISEPIDYLGVNYYSDTILERATGETEASHAYPGVANARETAPGSLTDMGWPITPDGLYDLLLDIRARHPGVPPIVITENGAAYDDPPGPDGVIRDERRIAYLDSHLRALHRAIAAGVAVNGYLVWTLIDNFEWAEGYSKRFGLVHLDRPTQRRTPRLSAAWYHEVIARNGVAAKSP